MPIIILSCPHPCIHAVHKPCSKAMHCLHRLHPLPQVSPPSSTNEETRAQEQTNRTANQAKLVACGAVQALLPLCLGQGSVSSEVVRATVSVGSVEGVGRYMWGRCKHCFIAVPRTGQRVVSSGQDHVMESTGSLFLLRCRRQPALPFTFASPLTPAVAFRRFGASATLLTTANRVLPPHVLALPLLP